MESHLPRRKRKGMYREPDRCPYCGKKRLKTPIPFELLFDLQVAAALIPMRYTTLKKFLHRHKAQFPAIYRKAGDTRRRRLLTGSDIIAIRKAVLRGPGRPRMAEIVAQAAAAEAFRQGGGPAVTGDPWSLP